MQNREITHIVKTDSLIPPKTHLVVRMFFLLPFERNLCQNKKKKIFYETKMQKLDLRL